MLYSPERRGIIEMLFPGNSEFHDLLDRIGAFCEREIMPGAKKLDQEGVFPAENLRRLSQEGIFALSFPAEYSGSGHPFPVYLAAIEMLADACANTALQVSVQGMVCEGIKLFGNVEQKRRFLKERGLAEGKKLIAFALTEPCCGSDAKSIQTTASRSGNTYLLSGSKMLITNAVEADYLLVFAKTEKGISAFLVDGQSPGLSVMKTMPKLGFRANSLSALRLERCAVPADNLLGDEGKGLEYAKHILNCGRITIAAIGVGIAQAALDKAIRHAKDRKAFGERLANFELIQEKIADMATEISAARLLAFHAAHSKYLAREISLEASKAKLFSSETALRACDHAIQIHGGYGYTDAYDVHRHWRDARLLTIGEGTSEMLRLLVAHLACKTVE